MLHWPSLLNMPPFSFSPAFNQEGVLIKAEDGHRHDARPWRAVTKKNPPINHTLLRPFLPITIMVMAVQRQRRMPFMIGGSTARF
ncbi:hypothetical protein KCP74_05945 [Salmonella enterica subsp. enterica]|nr:hypothetical protein KCP74_05945 [Salmonella enterica subsp. enterica]